MKSQPISIEKQPTINHFGTKAGPNIRHHLLSPFLASVNLHRENREYSFSLSITYTSIVSIEYQRNSFNQVHSRKCTCKRKYTCSEHIVHFFVLQNFKQLYFINSSSHRIPQNIWYRVCQVPSFIAPS
uniref:Uncharacterized protein n=1 Tax=Cacopsylla melanoneura TaxID=428564 RepID=A0A8D8UI67_9HEMI